MVGKKIREIRKEKGLSMRELARLSTVSSSTMSDIENERINPSIATLDKIAQALNVPIENIVANTKTEDKIDSFAIKLIEELLKEDIIEDAEHIPIEITNMIISALKKDIRKDSKK